MTMYSSITTCIAVIAFAIWVYCQMRSSTPDADEALQHHLNKEKQWNNNFKIKEMYAEKAAQNIVHFSACPLKNRLQPIEVDNEPLLLMQSASECQQIEQA